MIIVSQDKYNILNFNTTVNIGIEEISTLNYIVQITAQTNGNTIILGKYVTEERAKEVLQEIVKTYVLTEQYKVEYERTRIKLMMEGILLYEMPKE